ncbi:hypothetical protein F5X68DRAFT_44539 [Plectosphaerella plurivora]|uniref:Arginase-like protein n=1 Tax=Plectosphaerella plurivora TaxID=936078 RepID=A0A9P8V3V9_9PEZI|nr:hypothetical protein F5X68DRAFT_44539 [Plectosphaerella plurivora]
MAPSTTTDGSVVYERRTVKTHRYQWPGIQLNLWILVMLAAACFIIGAFANFISVQQQLNLPVPWYFPYFITVGALLVTYIFIILWLVFNQRLLPAIVMIGAFMLFVLWMVGTVVVSVQLFGPDGSIQGNCNLAVFSQNPVGASMSTLAWLQQRSICQTWQAIFAFCIVGCIFLLWIMVIAYQVFVSA